MQFVVIVVEGSDYILFASGQGAVGVVYRSRVGWCRGVTGIRNGIFLGVFGMSVEVALYFIGTGLFFVGSVSSNLNFRNGWRLGSVRVWMRVLARTFLVGGKWYSVCVWLQRILFKILLGLGVYFGGLCEVISDLLQMCLSTFF